MLNLVDYGFSNVYQEQIYDPNLIPARITAVHKERYEIVSKHGVSHARLKTSVYYNMTTEVFPTTGDFVLVQHNPAGDSVIAKTLKRQTYFSRLDPDPGRGEQAVAANFDYVFIMQSLNHDFNLKRLERYLTLAWESGALPVVILTKADLVDEYDSRLGEVSLVAAGVDVAIVSATTGYGLADLEEYVKPGKTVVFLGSSGVGKSSLVNALAGEDLMAVNTIREDDSRGRHTTTHRQLIMLPSGAMIIDTPGMRELGMWSVGSGLAEAFADVEEYLGQCRFSDCKHQTEPGCAILTALENGELPRERWQSYLRLQKEAKYSADKEAAMREKQEWAKSIAKFSKQRKKDGKSNH